MYGVRRGKDKILFISRLVFINCQHCEEMTDLLASLIRLLFGLGNTKKLLYLLKKKGGKCKIQRACLILNLDLNSTTMAKKVNIK